MKKVVIITAHPDLDTLCEKNADTLEESAKEQGFAVKRFRSLDFPWIETNPIKHGFSSKFDEPTKELQEADVVVITSPMWNYGSPAAFKNFIDGVVQHRKLFKFVAGKTEKKLSRVSFLSRIVPQGHPVGLMKAKKLLCVWTADGPSWYYKVFQKKNVLFLQIKAIFSFCGIKKFDQFILGMTRLRTEEEMKKWFNKLKNYKF
ncbi:NAD(P)H-dependent oxidoreductase [Candidatus Gracilibacteria bacterium]|nr:NAD(P)H-dependent oxidoreductase [Candidatus Gracilibacteria bacterium]